MMTGNPARSWSRQLLAAAMLAGLIGPAPPAAGGTIGISGNTLIAGAEPGDGPLALTGFISGTDLVLDGVDFAVVTPGCSAGPVTVSCALSGFTSLVIIGSNGNDAITLSSIFGHSFAITVLGAEGNDIILGSFGDDAIFGGADDDILFGGGGTDLLSGGAGNNLVFEGVDDPAAPEPVIEPLPRAAEVPAPGGLALLATGLGALGMARRRRQPAPHLVDEG